MLIFSGVKTLNKNRYLLEPPTSMVLIHHTALPPQHPLTPHNGEYCNFNYFHQNRCKALDEKFRNVLYTQHNV